MASCAGKIEGRYAMISRQDDENILLMFSDNIHFWQTPEVLLPPAQPWEFLKIGNCGSPIETEAGWLVLSHGVGAMRMPVDTLLSNWAYLVMAALAWTLKARFALRLPETGRWAAPQAADKAAVLRMEFKAFLHAFMLIPVQVVRTSRRLVFRLLAWNPWQAVFLRAFDQLNEPLRS